MATLPTQIFAVKCRARLLRRQPVDVLRWVFHEDGDLPAEDVRACIERFLREGGSDDQAATAASASLMGMVDRHVVAGGTQTGDAQQRAEKLARMLVGELLAHLEAEGTGSTKKAAKKAAAERMLELMAAAVAADDHAE